MSQQKFILVANIGNRNLIYKGLEEIDKNIYRSTTQKYWQTYKNSNGDIEVLADLQVSILPILLNKLLGEEDLLIDRLVLFSSNQLGINGVDNNKETKQDTLYAGKIIQALLKYDERYKIYREAIKFFEVKEIKASVIKPNQLIVNYQKQLKTLGDSYPDHLFIICDSGGTSQQKTSLKIAAEYLFDRDKYTYPNTEGYRYQSWYVKESTGNNGIIQLDKGEVIPSDVDEYRKIIDKRQIELLIKKGNYNAAAQIRENTEMNKNGLYKVLKFCAYRKRLLLQDAKDLYKVIGSEEDDFDDTNGRFRQVDDFIEEEPLGHFNRSLSKENNGWQDCLSKSHFRTVCETLAIADFHYLLGQWTDFVLASQVFIETYLSAFISHNTPFDIINNFEEDSKAYYKKGSSLPTSLTCKKNEQYDSFFQHTINEATYKTKSKKEKKEWALLFNWSVPCRFRFVEKFKNAPQHQLLIQTFKHYHSALMPTPKRKKFGIDKLRNKIAHKGIGVNNEKTINEYLLKSQDLPLQEQVLKSNSILALLSNWIELLEFKEEKNVYLRMNETIISYLKKE